MALEVQDEDVILKNNDKQQDDEAAEDLMVDDEMDPTLVVELVGREVTMGTPTTPKTSFRERSHPPRRTWR